MSETIADLFDAAVGMARGSESELARIAGCSQNAVWAARKAGRVSADMAVRLEAATKGNIPRWKWRPDLWSAPPAPSDLREAS